MKDQGDIIFGLRVSVNEKISEIVHIKSRDPTESFMNLLGLPALDFSNIDKEGNPPDYLEGLSVEARKNYVADLEVVYAHEKFNRVMDYVVNVLGNHIVHKDTGEPPQDRTKNGQMAIVGVKMIKRQLEKAHNEFMESKKVEEEFDEQEIL